MKSPKKLQKLADELTIAELAEIILMKANRKNINSEIEKIDEAQHYASYITYEITEIVKEQQRSYIVHKALSTYKETDNIDSLIQIIDDTNHIIKRKWLKLDYHAVELLEKAGFLNILGDEDDYHEQILVATDKLISFFKERETDDGNWYFSDVNEDLIKNVIETIIPKKGKKK